MRKVKSLSISLLSFVLIIAMMFSITTPVLAQTIAVESTEYSSSHAATLDEVSVEQSNIIGEDISKRDEYTKHFITDAGTTIAAQYAVPVHYKDANGEYVDFDNSLASSQVTISEATENEVTADEVSAYSLRTIEETEDTFTNKKSNSKVSHFKKSGKAKLVEITKDNHTISWGYSGANIVDAKQQKKDKAEELTGNDAFTTLTNLSSTVLYENIYNNVDLEVINSTVGVKENLILKDSNTKNVFKIEYNIGDLAADSIDSHTIELKDADGVVVYTISAPYMADAKGEKSEAVELKILKNNKGKLSVKLTADKEWLKDKSRVYPVTVDPAFTYGQSWGQIKSTYVNSGAANTSYTEGSFYVGRPGDNGIRRSLLKIPNLPSLNIGDMVVNAQLVLWQVDNYPTIDMYVGVYESKSDWTKNNKDTWATQPGFIDNLIDYEKCEALTYGWRGLDITELVKKWYNGADNNGFYLTMLDESNVYQGLWFSSSLYPTDSTVRPELIITYLNNKGIEGYWSYTELNMGEAGTAYINDYSGNLVYSLPLSSTYGITMPITLSCIYNSYLADVKNSGFSGHTGKGWRMSIQQTLAKTSSDKGLDTTIYPYVYTDEDSTEHYFKKVTEDGVEKLIDEGGTGLELTVNSNSTYTITNKDKYKWNFNSKYVLTSIEDNIGKKVTINYQSFDSTCIKSIVDADGKTITFEVNDQNNKYIQTIKDSDQKSTVFSYGTNARLASITRPDNKKVLFGYDNTGRLTSVTNIDGKKLTFSYANNGSKGVERVQEYGTDGTTLGQTMTFNREKYNTTVIRTSGLDSVFDNEDDILTELQFDNFGRTVTLHNKTASTGEYLGAATTTYTSGTTNSSNSNIKYLNKITKDHSMGANTENIVKGHNFESLDDWGSAEWGDADTGTVSFNASVNTTSPLYSKKALQLNVSATSVNAGGSVYQEIPVANLQHGETYTLSAYVKTESIVPVSGAETYGAAIGVTQVCADNTTINSFSDYVSRVTDTEINSGYRRLSTTFSVSDNLSSLTVNLFLYAATGVVRFDAVQLEKGDAPSAYNLLENSSLERYETSGMPTSWTSSTLTLGSQHDWKSNDRMDGKYSFGIKGNIGANKYIWQDIPVNSGATESDSYVISGWAMGASVPKETNGSSFRLIGRVYFSDNTYKENNAYFNTSINNGQWQYTCTPFTLSDGTSTEKIPTFIRVFLVYNKQGNIGYFDNIQLTKEDVPSYTYDKDGNVISVVANAEQESSYKYSDNKLTEYVAPNGGKFTYDYNNKNQLITARTPRNISYNYTYDSVTGKANSVEASSSYGTYIKAEVNYQYNADKSKYTITAKDQDGWTTSSVVNANNGLTESATNVNGDSTSYEYNTAKHPTGVQFIDQSVNYEYNNKYQLVNLIHSGTGYGGTTYSFAYDSFGNNTTTHVGNRLLSTFTYGANNGYLSRIDYGELDDAVDNYIAYTYDTHGNISTLNYNGTKVGENFADHSGNIIRTHDLINNTQTQVSYDTTGRLVSKDVSALNASDSTDSWIRSFEYDFNLNNNLIRRSFADKNIGHTTTYSYENDNLLDVTTIKNSKSDATKATLDYNYDRLGRTTAKILTVTGGGTLVTSYMYADSERNNMADNTSAKLYTTNRILCESIADFDYEYTYDSSGNITKITNIDDTEDYLHFYEYDDYNHLITHLDAENETYTTYTYDNGGNITRKWIRGLNADKSPGNNTISDVTYTYGDSDWADLLTEYNGQTITYDDIGNPVAYRDGITMSWQNGRELASFEQNGSSVAYTYDLSGLRTSKTVTSSSGTTTAYTYVYEDGQLVQMTRGSRILDFIYDGNGVPISVAYRSRATSTPTYYYYAVNSRGDVIALYNSNGTIAAQYEYDAYGKLLGVTTSSGVSITSETSIAIMNPLRYRGYVYDNETGLYYNSTRYYDPTICRFVNADTTDVLTATLSAHNDKNLFAYCDNNPVSRADDDGEFWNYVIGGVVGAVVGGISAAISGGDWKAIALGAGVGAVGGLLAASGIPAGFQIVAGGLLSGANNLATQTLIEGKSLQEVDKLDVLIDTAIGAGTSALAYGVTYNASQAAESTIKTGINKIISGKDTLSITGRYGKGTIKKGLSYMREGIRDRNIARGASSVIGSTSTGVLTSIKTWFKNLFR